MATVYDFFPELSPCEVDELLESFDYPTCVSRLDENVDEFLVRLASRRQLVERRDRLENIDSFFDDEPIPFFVSTWKLANLSINDLRDAISQSGHSYASAGLVVSFVARVVGELQRVLLKAQLAYVERHFHFNDEHVHESSYGDVACRLAGETQLFAEEYGVAAYLADHVAHSHYDYFKEILNNLNNDRPLLEKWGIGRAVRLKNLKLNLGDSHAGRSVALIEFENGDRILYKPRSLRAEQACSLFSQRLQELLGFKYLQTCPILDRGDYGWAKYIADDQRSRFSNPSAIAEFACFLKLLAFSDMHYENVLFQEGVPILIDAETVLSGGLEGAEAVSDPIHSFLSSLVSSSGLFPSPLIVPKKTGDTFVDIGVLGRRDGTSIKERQLVVKDPYTTKMRVAYEDVARHLPTEMSEHPIGLIFVETVCKTFCDFMRRALNKREKIVSAIYETFYSASVRVVLQDTIRYTNAIQLATNQRCLTNGAYFVAALSRSFLRRSELPRSILAYEIDRLSSNDIPRYSVACTSTSLLGDGVELEEEYFSGSPIDSCIARLRSLEERAIDLDSWLIKVTFAPYYDEKSNRTGFVFDAGGKNRSGDQLPKLTSALRELELGYFQADDHDPATWIGARLSPHAHQYWYVDELSLDLYAGSTGVALPLAIADHLGIDGIDGEAASRFFSNLLLRLESLSAKSMSLLEPGAISGAQSTLWALDIYFDYLDDKKALERVRDVALRALATMPQRLDYISGISGLVVLAQKLGVLDRTNLLETFIGKLQAGLTHGSKISSQSGYAHGLAGYLGALASLDVPAEKKSTVDRMSNDLLSLLLSIRSREDGLWRISDTHPQSGRGWCSGTPGILLALAQAHASPCVLECDIDDVILYLVNEVKQNTFGGNPTLCHGDVGNLWLLEHVGELIADDDLKNESVSAGHQWMASVFPSYIRSLSRSSVSHGLFVGIGGACMYAEHLLSPTTTVRSPLWLE